MNLGSQTRLEKQAFQEEETKDTEVLEQQKGSGEKLAKR